MSWVLAEYFVYYDSRCSRILVEVITHGAPRGGDKRAGVCGCRPGLCAAAHDQPRTPVVPMCRADVDESTYF